MLPGVTFADGYERQSCACPSLRGKPPTNSVPARCRRPGDGDIGAGPDAPVVRLEAFGAEAADPLTLP